MAPRLGRRGRTPPMQKTLDPVDGLGGAQPPVRQHTREPAIRSSRQGKATPDCARGQGDSDCGGLTAPPDWPPEGPEFITERIGSGLARTLR